MTASKSDDPGFESLRPEGRSRFVLICDHATNRIPGELDRLGLGEGVLATHIAWDIGAAGVARRLAERFDAPAILSTVSRLVIDCNRHPDAPDLIPEISDGTIIPGNRGLTDHARSRRLERWFSRYHAAIEALLDDRGRSGHLPMVISVHSMAATLQGIARPWQVALATHHERRFAEPVLAALRRLEGVAVGDNQPYDLDPAIDFSIPHHAMRRNLPHLQVEFRQDQVGDAAGQETWARRFADAVLAVS